MAEHIDKKELMHDELVKSLRLCTSDKRGYGCAKECTYGKKHPLNWLCMDYLLKEAANAIEELSKPHWIPVTKMLPKENGEYLVSGNDKVWVCEFMILGDVGGWCNNARNPCVKYWKPRPEPPKEET